MGGGKNAHGSNGADRQSSVQMLKYIDPSTIGDPKQRAALIETQNRADFFFNGDYENSSVLEPLVYAGIVNANDSYIVNNNDAAILQMQHNAQMMRTMGMEPQYTPYATTTAMIAGMTIDSLPPFAFLNGVGTMVNARSPWEFSLGAVAAAVAVVPGVSRGVPKPSAYSVLFETQIARTGAGTRAAHKALANENLRQAMSGDKEFARMMSEAGVTPASGSGTPAGFRWHHAQEPGAMQLVPETQHTSGSIYQDVLHPGGSGGYADWGKDW